MKAYLVVYDIPASPGGKPVMANPSDMLRGLAVRINYSCWIVPERNVPMIPLKEMRDAGAKVEMVRFDENDFETLIRLAKQALTDECSRLRKQLRSAIKGIEDRYAKAHDEVSLVEFDKAYAYHHINLRRVRSSATSAQACAMAFDLTGDFKELFDGLRKAIEAADLVSKESHDKAKRRVRP